MAKKKGGKKSGGGGAPKSMHGAVSLGDLEAMAGYLDAEAGSLEERNKDGWTPLMTAAFRGELEALEWLIGKGAALDAVCVCVCVCMCMCACMCICVCVCALLGLIIC